MSTVTQLGYLGFEVSDLSAWEKFGTEVLGLGLAERKDKELRFRLDSYKQRFIVTEGPADNLSVAGWQVDDEAALGAVAERLRGAGVDVTEGTPDECESRSVAGLIKLVDCAGNPTEVFHGAEKASEPFNSEVVRSGFIAEEQGLGHVVLTANSQAESTEFYSNLLGFKLSDHIRCTFHGFPVDLAFFHINPRHHSVAFGAQQKKRLHHFMVEAKSMDEVGLAFDRALKSGLRIMQTLGRHPNDRMFSFYAQTPSKFQFEFGWGGRQVDDSTWETTEYNCISEWGHHPPMVFAPPPKR